ncbi:hypothetical protein AB6A40_007275 [Gnathostoma spinigerum]|uniref:non-specific serine/threonine protein kinase n=1 Tax=Gnathostoma spinigerum TaxID=75299 RepID=A0ABD6EMQ8_9BILA
MSSEVDNLLHPDIDSPPWHSANLSVTVGADDGDEESEVDDLQESFRAWSAVAGPASVTIERGLDKVDPDFTSQLVSNDYVPGMDAVLSELFSDGNRLFQPLSDANFTEEVFAEKKPKILNGYLFGDTIGEGSYSKVKEILEEATLVRRAVKIIKDSRLRKIPNGRANVEQEIRILRRVHHRNVVALYDVFRNEQKEKLYMVMEYCLGSVQQMLDGSKEKKFPIFQAHHFFTQLIDGLSYLHSQGVIHKDIKPGNLLVTLNGTLKISDFGVAELLDRFAPEDWCTVAQGTPKFQPPEIVSGTVERYHGYKVDIWSSGVTLYNMISGEYPFEGDVIMRLFENIANQPLSMPRSVVVSEPLAVLISAMLEKDPDERISISGIYRSAWFQQKHIADEALRVHVSVCNNMPSHRPLSVYAPLEQMYGSQMEEEIGDLEHEPEAEGAFQGDMVSCSMVDTVRRPTSSSSKLICSEDAEPRAYSAVGSGHGDSVPLNESKRNRSILSMCMGSACSP